MSVLVICEFHWIFDASHWRKFSGLMKTVRLMRRASKKMKWVYFGPSNIVIPNMCRTSLLLSLIVAVIIDDILHLGKKAKSFFSLSFSLFLPFDVSFFAVSCGAARWQIERELDVDVDDDGKTRELTFNFCHPLLFWVRNSSSSYSSASSSSLSLFYSMQTFN